MFYTYIYIRKCSLDICTALLHYGMTHNQIVFPASWSQYFSGYLLAYTKYAGYFTQNILHITVVYLDDCEFLFMYINQVHQSAVFVHFPFKSTNQLPLFIQALLHILKHPTNPEKSYTYLICQTIIIPSVSWKAENHILAAGRYWSATQTSILTSTVVKVKSGKVFFVLSQHNGKWFTVIQ